MNVLSTLRSRFADAIAKVAPEANVETLSSMVKSSAEAKFGDYQANMAMAMSKQVGKPPRDVAAELIAAVDVSDLCDEPEVAGPGFINLRLRDGVLVASLTSTAGDATKLIPTADSPLNVIIDFSSPNVAKPMHVGHLRSTVIGDSLQRIYRALGHEVTSDNHVGDWGTQFGMILFGYKNFRDQEAYEANPVQELARLYRAVNQLIAYPKSLKRIPTLESEIHAGERKLVGLKEEAPPADKTERKKLEASISRSEKELKQARLLLDELTANVAFVEHETDLLQIAKADIDVARDARLETSKLHAGDEENVRLWNEFMPECMKALQGVYDRLGVTFDLTLGESHYNPQLAGVVDDLKAKGLAAESDGAMCVFVDGNDAPLIVQKADGAFTYGTTDLATIQDRVEQHHADRVLYVVDLRQGEHFKLLFETAKTWGYPGDYRHVSFGTVLGKDGKPYKTRSGDAVGLESLLDEAVAQALKIVSENDDSKPSGAELGQEERKRVANVVGLGGIKYADLMHNRESDYTFSYEKMLATRGNTATYMQYAYARIAGIFRKLEVDPAALDDAPILLGEPAERALALKLLRFGEAVAAVADDNRPNILTDYLFDLAGAFSTFYDQCSVKGAETEDLKVSRLKLVRLTGDVIRVGLDLLGIGVCEKM